MAKRSHTTETSKTDLERELAQRQRRVEQLQRERDRLQGELAKLDESLSTISRDPQGLRSDRVFPSDSKLEQAIVRVLQGKTMGVGEIAQAVQEAGYRTISSNFRAIVNQVLLRSNHIKKVSRGRFTAAEDEVGGVSVLLAPTATESSDPGTSPRIPGVQILELEARQTALGREELTSDVPEVSEASLRRADQDGVIQIGMRVQAGDFLIGRVTPTPLDDSRPEVFLVRKILKNKGQEVANTSLYAPVGTDGVVIGVEKSRDALSHRLDRVRVHVCAIQSLRDVWNVWQTGGMSDPVSDKHKQHSPRLDFSSASLAQLAEVFKPQAAPELIARLEELLREAQVEPPSDRAAFVRDLNELLDVFSLRIQTEGGGLGRLSLNSSGGIGITRAGRGGNRGFKGAAISLVCVPRVHAGNRYTGPVTPTKT